MQKRSKDPNLSSGLFSVTLATTAGRPLTSRHQTLHTWSHLQDPEPDDYGSGYDDDDAACSAVSLLPAALRSGKHAEVAISCYTALVLPYFPTTGSGGPPIAVPITISPSPESVMWGPGRATSTAVELARGGLQRRASYSAVNKNIISLSDSMGSLTRVATKRRVLERVL